MPTAPATVVPKPSPAPTAKAAEAVPKPDAAPDVAPAKEVQPLNNAFAELDTFFQGKGKGKEAEPVAAKEIAVEPVADEVAPEPEPAPDATKSELDKHEPARPPAKAKAEPKELRNELESTRQKLKSYEKELADLKSKSSKLPDDDPRIKASLEAIAAKDKQLEDLQKTISLADYTKSKDYEDKYQKPLATAFKNAVDLVGQFRVENESGEPIPATEDHIRQLISMPAPVSAAKAAEWFGVAAPIVLTRLERIQELLATRAEAVAQHREQALSENQQQTVVQMRQQERLAKLWEESNDYLAKKDPESYAAKEGDEDGNKSLEEGQALSNRVFLGRTAEDPETLVQLDALVSRRAAAFPRERTRRVKAENRIKELEAELAQYVDSAPSRGKEGDAPEKNMTWEDDLAAEFKKR